MQVIDGGLLHVTHTHIYSNANSTHTGIDQFDKSQQWSIHDVCARSLLWRKYAKATQQYTVRHCNDELFIARIVSTDHKAQGTGGAGYF